MISFVVVSVVLLTKAVCHLTVGPGVCKRDQMSKANNNSQQETTFCCEGYKEKNDICVDCPDCTSMICPENYCGDTCIEMCDCPLNAYCDRRFCCRCKPGLHGVFCNETCAQGYYGPRCKHKCMCKRHEKCDSGTGNCTSNSSNTSNTSTICKPGTASHNNMDSCADSNNSNSLLHDDKSVTSGKFQEEFYKD
ncbi:uncharacterized protein LOC143077009 [Mytilus galloprovincialis]|uniref:uncharacterized protein LOC143077009 n=1 Tax=Mytilus galloprovincialis TaxID=29158 RepID=UPI003F7BBB2B